MIEEKIDLRKYDPRELGLKVGLELHQQLDTAHKLFCSCPSKLVEEGSYTLFERRLRPTRSELGEVDVAALFEWQRGRVFEYQSPHSASCLVEYDEEPPHDINEDAIIIALAVAKALNSIIVDEIHVMRKIVIDGSNTTGFQRTAIVALGGYIVVNGKKVGIQSIAVEEDAARKVLEKNEKVVYRLDRLGIPLIEISTEPDMSSPDEVYETALSLGLLLRLTGRVKRGLGTIRQDLNISIKNGVRTEIKGVQRLDILPKIVLYEAIRQARLLELREELKSRGVTQEEIKSSKIIDVTEIFTKTQSKIIKKALKRNGRVFAVKLPKFHGLLKFEVQPGRRFGTELADYARFWGGVGGIFHSDELPAYGISEEEVEKIYEKLNATKGEDAFVVVADQEEKALQALKAILLRAAYALKGIPKETRAALEDGTTRYSRPQPGAARMYPETDIPPLEITDSLLKKAEKIKPKHPKEKLRELIEKYKLSQALATQLLRSPHLDLFEELVVKYKSITPTLIASMLTSTLKSLEREGIPVERIDQKDLSKILDFLERGEIAKEAIPEILAERALKPNKSLEEIIEKYRLMKVSEEELEKIIDEAIASSINIIREKGLRAINIIMGKVMPKLRGKIDGGKVAAIVRRKLLEIIRKQE